MVLQIRNKKHSDTIVRYNYKRNKAIRPEGNIKNEAATEQLELDENGIAPYEAELYRKIVEPIRGIPILPPFVRHP